MQVGVVFPQTEIGSDPAVVRDFAQAVEGMGFSHLLSFEHVLGADRDRPGGFTGPYDKDTLFHEPFVLYGFLAGVTERIELVTGVVVLPQRQAQLVAKQAAEVDVLSGGRLRLGIGTGWNAIEYAGMSENFHNRGKRQEEQVEVMRLLWNNDSVDYQGRWHTLPKVGINPRPSRSIPVWFGGNHPNVLDRVARIGDGWLPQYQPGADLDAAIERIAQGLEAAGRDRASVGIEGRMRIDLPRDQWGPTLEAWERAGATHVAVLTMNAGFASPREHLDALRAFREVVA